jgi:hypothetical protein
VVSRYIETAEPIAVIGVLLTVSRRPTGVFRAAQENGATTVFLAPYGDPDDPAEGPQVRLECDCRPEGG